MLWDQEDDCQCLEVVGDDGDDQVGQEQGYYYQCFGDFDDWLVVVVRQVVFDVEVFDY